MTASVGRHPGAAAYPVFVRPTRIGVGFSRARQILCVFSPDAALCLRPGPDPAASIRTVSTTGWVNCRGSDRLFSFKQAIWSMERFHQQRMRALSSAGAVELPGSTSTFAMDAFLECIEPAHKRQLRDIRHNSWGLYSALVRAPGMDELLDANVGLALALSNHAELATRRVQWPMRAIRRLLRRRRREIAAALGWPDREASVRVLAKLAPAAASAHHLKALRELARDPAWLRRLSHLPSIEEDTVRLLAHPVTRNQCSQRFLLDLAAPVTRQSLTGLIQQMNENFVRSGRALPTLHSIEQVLELNDIGHDLVRPKRRRRLEKFGPAPVPGTATIVALKSSVEIDREAATQQNCVANGTYEAGIARGDLFVYRVTAPERCTLSIQRSGPGEDWEIGELRTRLNGRPAPATVAAVQEWLRGQYELAKESDAEEQDDPRQLAFALANCGL